MFLDYLISILFLNISWWSKLQILYPRSSMKKVQKNSQSGHKRLQEYTIYILCQFMFTASCTWLEFRPWYDFCKYRRLQSWVDMLILILTIRVGNNFSLWWIFFSILKHTSITRYTLFSYYYFSLAFERRNSDKNHLNVH